jgi:hypothetical protein
LSEAVYSDGDTNDPHKTNDTHIGSFGLSGGVDVDGGLRKKLVFDKFDKEGKFKVFSFSFRCYISIVSIISRSFILRQDVNGETIVFPLILCLMMRRVVFIDIVDGGGGGYTIIMQVLSLSGMHFGEQDLDGTYTQWGDQQVSTIIFYSD